MDYRQQADRAIEAGDYDRARELWRGIAGDGTDPATLLQHLQLLHALYQFSEAEPVARRLLEHPQVDAHQLLVAAKRHFASGRIRESATFSGRALELQPGDADTLAIHAASLERIGEKAAARRLLEAALEAEPEHLRCVRLLAHIERQDGDLEVARARLIALLGKATSSDDWRLAYELAGVHDRLGNYDEAMAMLEFAKSRLALKLPDLRAQWRTASGRQWEVTASLGREDLQRWSAPIDPALRLCLMAGFPRSGTTLLERVLTAHPDCVGTDETGIMARQFRDPIVLAAESAGAALAELDSFDTEQLAVGRTEYWRCTEEFIAEPIGGRLLIEKEPLLTADLPVPLRLFPEAKILMPLRDPRDVVMSFFFTIVPLSADSAASSSLEDSCRYYAEVMRHWLHLREILPPGRWMESRYEDLLADPELQTRRLAGFLGIEWSAQMLDHRKRDASRAISTPTYDDVSRPLYTRAIDRWKNYHRWLEPHLHHLEPFLRAFGYKN